MTIPSAPSSKDLADNLIRVGKNVKTYRTSLKGTINWNVKVGKQNKIPEAAFKKLSRAAQFFREGHYSLEDIKQIKENTKKVQEAAKKAKEVADATKKATDLTEKIHKALFAKIPGKAGNYLDAAATVGSILGIFAAIGFVLLTKLQEFITGRIFDNLDSFNEELTKANTIATNNGLKLKTFDAKLQKFERELNANAKDYYQLNKQQESFAKTVAEAKKQANDALYETREGRKITTGLVEAARKIGNDALYEARQNKVAIEAKITEQRLSFDAKIQQINATIAKFNNSVSDAFQKSVNATISKIQSDLVVTKAQVSAIRPQTVDTNSITANAVAAARALVTPLQSQIGALSGQTNAAATLAGIAVSGVSNLAQAVSGANNTASVALGRTDTAQATANNAQREAESTRTYVDRALVPRIEAVVTQSTGVKAIAENAQDEAESTRNYVERVLVPRIEATVTQSTGVTAEMAKLEGETQNTRNYVERVLVPRIEATVTESTGVKAEVAEIQQQIPALSNEIKQSQTHISEVDTKIREQEKVNALALPKLDQIVGILGLIPARAADAIKPSIPTIPQIENATGTAMCNNLKTGCGKNAIDDAVGNINDNSKKANNDLLDKLNAGANAAQLVLLNTINTKLGSQLVGGIAGKLTRFADWMHLDRVLNVMILGATIHNALMLSNDIGQTFVVIINNVLQLIGLKKEDGSAFDIGSVISSSIENLIKGAIGAENYQELTTAWAKANRIYQATTNILNSFQNLTSTVLSGLELVAGQTGKIGNALRASGEVLESAYQWMNPQPKINRVTNFLERLQNGASTIQQVTQVPLDTINAITELQTANTEFIKAIKEDDKPENKGATVEEPAKLAESKALAKELSKGLELIGIDLEADD